MTVQRALETLLELDKQLLCPRPTIFGEMTWLLSRLALAAGHANLWELDNDLEFEDFGDLSFLLEDAALPKDAGRTWRLD